MQAMETKLGVSPLCDDVVVQQHLTMTANWKRERDGTSDSCTGMLPPQTNMDYEQCQDLSGLAWFETGSQPWAVAESSGQLADMLHVKDAQSGLIYENANEYNLNNDLDGPFYMTRRDSMEDVKSVTAPNNVVPMRQHEALHIQSFIKTENKTEDDIWEPKVDADLFLDTQDLLSELGDRDLIDYIVSEGSPQQDSPITHKSLSPIIEPIVKQKPPTPVTEPIIKQNIPMKETYLAIPRNLTAGTADETKIPKMLILKTPQSAALNFKEMSMSIAERIKTVGKRPRPKRYTPPQDLDDEDDDDDNDSDEELDEVRPSKRSRRLSTTSSSSTTFSDRYRELRDKNNEASRKSRQNRKEKEKDLMKSMQTTEKENLRLRARADELEKLVLSLRKLLLQIVLSKGSIR